MAAQKFISDIANDAFVQCSLKAARRKDKKNVLTMEELTTTVSGYGININKPAYHAAKPGVVKERKVSGTATTSGGGRGRQTK